jgi:RNA polymerase sigma-70 factor (ECF subfamily)
LEEWDLSEKEKRARFERLVLPHLDAAYSLATWLVRDDAQAEEAVQDSYLRAFRYFDSLRGDDARPWLLGIVRNTCYSLLQRARQDGAPLPFDEEGCGEDAVAAGAVVSFPVNPEAAAIREADCESVRSALRALPVEFREAVVLREIHGFSYREIAAACEVPIGTVMSRIARGRRLLQQALGTPVQNKDTGT